MFDDHGKPCRNCGTPVDRLRASGLCRECWKSRAKHDLNKYKRIGVNHTQVFEHRLVWEQAHGKLPKGWLIHHYNGLKGDNRLENLFAMPKSNHNTHSVEQALQMKIRSLEEVISNLTKAGDYRSTTVRSA